MARTEPQSTLAAASDSISSGVARSGDYVVVARRYRPQTFDELIGQEHVAKALSNAIRTGRVGHAYLFTGARGVGKTSAARILAKALDCVHGPTPTPCNQCDICQSISIGADVDVLEIDGASNRGIDEIRQLRQNVSVRPSRARFKIYIIDEVHMLTREAFNALLKTLEEPPEHVKFIFCTTEANKIPITILSRCQRFDFAGIRTPSIQERLQQIVASEGVTAEPEALELLARRANGSMRDSQSLLEQLLSFGGQHLTVADVHALLGTAADTRLSELAQNLVGRNAGGAIASLDTALAEGVDVGQLLEQLLGYFRDVMVAAVGCGPDSFLYGGSSDNRQISSASQALGLETILGMMQIIDHTLGRLRYSTQGRTLAELALVRICSLENLEELPGLIAHLRGEASLPSATAGRSTEASVSPNSLSPAKKKDELKSAVVVGANGEGTANGHSPIQRSAGGSPEPLTAENSQAIWNELAGSFGDLLGEYASLASRVASTVPNKLVVSFPHKYNFGKAFCERPEQLGRLERGLAEILGQPVKLEFVLLQDSPEQKPAPTRAAVGRQRMAETAEHPLVRRATELFGGAILRVEQPEQP
jgi:DNA polymerase III subunit gamma/tau